MTSLESQNLWPPIPYPEWQDTCATLHLWTQIVGKVRLVLTPWVNHSWHATFYPTARGLTSSPIPYPGGDFQTDFDFLSHELVIARSDGSLRRLALRPQTVADFYAEFMAALGEVGIEIRIDHLPNEIPNPIPFHKDREHKSYDGNAAQRFWRALLSSHRVLREFRTGFLGKVSPVHFFWGSFDLAVTRFSGRKAPLLPGGPPGLPLDVSQEAYSHEVSSAGFWPGNGGLGYPAFYSYSYPQPKNFETSPVGPKEAFYDKNLKEFILPYDAIRNAPDPDAALLEFLESTYRAAAENGAWDRAALECPRGRPGVPRPLK
jgi:uncharacterized protein DUF5996